VGANALGAGGVGPAIRVSLHFLFCEVLGETYRSAEPVSKSRFKVLSPAVIGVTYSSSSVVGWFVAEPD
jgi:hypothetical protein